MRKGLKFSFFQCERVYSPTAEHVQIRATFSHIEPAALLGAFRNRFGIGLETDCVRLSWPGWAVGLFFGLLLSLHDAIITKVYAPILVLGCAGGWSSAG